MALSAITVANTDHFVKGGIDTLTVGEYGATTLFDTSADDGTVENSSLVQGASTQVLSFDKETANMKVSSSQEKGLMIHTVTIEGYVPNMALTTLVALENMRGKPLNALVKMYSNVTYLVGYDPELGTGDGSAPTTTLYPLVLTGIEVDSGTALVDANGATLTFTAVQGRLPLVTA